MTSVFINGSSGTTGLRLRERLATRGDVRLLEIAYEKRRDPEEVHRLIAMSDVTFLCLPDDAAREAVRLAEGTGARIIDTSTAHRTDAAWVYGFPELSKGQRERVMAARRLSVPGCHAGGFVALVYPLIARGILHPDYPLSCHSLTGYSGGGKTMIAEYENPDRAEELARPRQYAFSQAHKHLPEMTALCALEYEPIFTPVVEDFYSGMLVTVPLHTRLLRGAGGIDDVRKVFCEHYAGSKLIEVSSESPDGFLDAAGMSGKDGLQIFVSGNDERVVLAARFDNLGKGASGAAVQCFNLMTGANETDGLLL